MNHQVAAQVCRADALGRINNQRAVGHRQVVVVDVFFAFKDDF